MEVIIPRYNACHNKGCSGFAVLDPMLYHFLNTGKPYMLRTCPKCGTTYLIIIERN